MQKHTDALRALIVKTAKQQQSDKAELQEAIDGVEGTTLLHIDSSRGTVFKHSAVETRLTVVLYRGGERITDAQAMRAAFGSGATAMARDGHGVNPSPNIKTQLEQAEEIKA